NTLGLQTTSICIKRYFESNLRGQTCYCHFIPTAILMSYETDSFSTLQLVIQNQQCYSGLTQEEPACPRKSWVPLSEEGPAMIQINQQALPIMRQPAPKMATKKTTFPASVHSR